MVIVKGTSSEFCFSSNYLVEKTANSDDYEPKTIIASENGFTIYLDIYNFPPTDINKFNKDKITFEFTVELFGKDGTKNTDQTEIINLLSLDSSFFAQQEIQGGAANTKTYPITCSQDNMSALLQYQKIRIIATPTSPETLLVNKVLAADFVLASSSQSTHWQVRNIDKANGYSIDQLDAINYEIYGTAQESVTLTWPEEKVALSPWSKKDLGIVETGNTGTATFSVGGDGKPSSYLLQFYKVADNIDELTINLSPNS